LFPRKNNPKQMSINNWVSTKICYNPPGE